MRKLLSLLGLAVVVSSPVWVGVFAGLYAEEMSIRAPRQHPRLEVFRVLADSPMPQGKRGGYPASQGHVVAQDPRTKDPTKCTKVCTPEGYEGALPREFPDDVERVACEGDYCARAKPGGAPPDEGDGEEDCKAHFSCSVHCSEVCCVCLRECI